MNDIEFLSKEEQYKDILNNEEIKRIEDLELRSIRLKYWNLRRKAWLDEAGIPDTEIARVQKELKEKEQKEIAEYRKRKGE